MTKNKRHFCRFENNGCGGSCYGLKRIREHEATCRFCPPEDMAQLAMKARMTSLEEIISGLVRADEARAKQVKRMAMEMKNLRLQVVDLQSNVSRLVPDYTYIKLELLHLSRYIMSQCESRQWSELMRGRCKYDNPKYIFEVFLKHLIATEAPFFKIISYDTVEATVDFGDGPLQARMLLRDFILRFMEVCLVLMKDLWPNVTEINKIPHVPRVLCCGYSKGIVHRLERGNKFIQAQYAKSHRAEIIQAHNERLDSLMELARQEFSTKYKSNSNMMHTNLCRNAGSGNSPANSASFSKK
jgi:hypothetical protein